MNPLHKPNSASFHYEVLKKRKATIGERAADRMTAFIGSWKFIISFILFIVIWILINIFAWWTRWDPFPFILLNLTLSSLTALHAPIIMMSQNRQTARDRLQAGYDYAIDKKAEREIEEIQAELQEIKARLDVLISSKK